MELYIAHPESGLIILDDNKQSIFSINLDQFCSGIDNLGKILHLALSYDK